MIKTGWHLYEFGPFRLDPAEHLLLRDNKPVAVTAKAFDALLVLLEGAGHLVSKAELMRAVWPNSFVEEGNVAVTISMLRKALGDEGPEHRYIKTVSRQGYRFVGDVREAVASEPAIEPGDPVARASTPELLIPEVLPAEDSIRESPAATLPTGRKFPLRWTGLILVVSLGALVASVPALMSLRKTITPRPPIGSLAVLPFRSSNLDPARNYLRVGMADAIITRLAASGHLVVRPTTAILEYANSPADPITIGRAQKVDTILFGTIEASSERMRVNVQLIRTVDRSLVWAGNFDGLASQIFDLEKEVEDKVAEAVSIQLPSRESSPGMTTRDPEANRLYLEGRYFWNKRTEAGLRRSIESFQRATLADSGYASAYSGLADSYALLASYGVEPVQQAYPSAKAAALKAVQLDARLAEAHTSMGMISFYYEWNWRQAENEFRRSIELNPNYALAHTWYSLELAAQGRSAEALSQIETAYRLDPLSLSINTEVGRIYYSNGQYDRAIEAFRRVIDLDPHFARAHTKIGMAYAAKKDFDAALREFDEARELSGPDPYLDGLAGYAQAFSGDKAMARKTLAELTNRAKSQFVPAFSMALICVGLGDRDEAFEWLSHAYQDRSTYMVYAKVDPLLDPIRSDPRFIELIRRMGLL